MRVMVIGGSGQVGSLLCEAHLNREDEIWPTHFRSAGYQDNSVHLDLSDQYDVSWAINGCSPEIVYLAGAETNVDECERDPQKSWKVNVVGTANVVRAAQEAGARLVFLSSDFVFDGLEGAYDEECIPNPINEYGRQKLIAEHLVMQSSLQYLIIRTNVVYGPDRQRKNFILRLIDNLNKGLKFSVATDEYGSPTYGPDLARRVVELATTNDKAVVPNGIYHLAGSQMVNRYKFAMTAARIFKCDTNQIQPIRSVDLGRPALRPLNAGLRSKDRKNRLPDYVDRLSRLKELFDEGRLQKAEE